MYRKRNSELSALGYYSSNHSDLSKYMTLDDGISSNVTC